MTAPVEIPVADDAGVYLAVSCNNYYNADMALWTIKAALSGRTPTSGEQTHLDQLRKRRKEAYADVVAWVMTVEAQRVHP